MHSGMSCFTSDSSPEVCLEPLVHGYFGALPGFVFRYFLPLGILDLLFYT